MSNADVYVVVRQQCGGRRVTPAYYGAVYNTHKEAMNAMNKHKESLRRYSKHDAKNVFVKRTSNPRSIR